MSISHVAKLMVPPQSRCQLNLILSPSTTAPHRLTFLLRRHIHHQPRGLRLPRDAETSGTEFGFEDELVDKIKKRKSRNEMKRDARVSVRFGMDLASFSPPQIKQILRAASLEQEVYEALMLVKKLGPDVREGKRRQFNYIGKLLRDVQPDLLSSLIHAMKEGDQSRFQETKLAGSTELIDEDTEEEFHESESEQELEDSSKHLVLANRWCDGLISKDIQISNEVYSIADVEFDRQELRKLVREVHRVQDRQNDNEDDSTIAELAAVKKSLNLFLISLAKHLLLSGESTTFTIINKCGYTIWPGILSNAGVSQLPTTGFPLQIGESKSITPGTGWAGRLWGRTLCSSDSSTGNFTCTTGDCGSGKVDCSGSGATPPATLVEFTLSGAGGMDFYDVSLVDGYNLPILVVPRGGGGVNCSYTGCMANINSACPSQLRVTRVGEGDDDGGGSSTVACKSACSAFNSDEYCCRGEFGSPDTCKASSYSVAFKNACPRAYSYAYDDKSSTFTCGGSPDYTITFCPSSTTSQKASSSPPEDEGEGPPSTSASITNSTMVYEGALDFYSSAPYTCQHTFPSLLIAGAISIFTVICQLLLF